MRQQCGFGTWVFAVTSELSKMIKDRHNCIAQRIVEIKRAVLVIDNDAQGSLGDTPAGEGAKEMRICRRSGSGATSAGK